MEIPTMKILEREVFTIDNEESFARIALQVFNYQFERNNVYREYCSLLARTPERVRQPGDIPFLPISFFKTHQVIAGTFSPQITFTSSGTTGLQTSSHHVKDLSLYKRSFLGGFQQFFGNVNQYCILGLLPSYLERQGSSLVYMVEALIKESGHSESGFYLYETEKLHHLLQKLEANAQPTLLFGVSYALLDFAEKYSMPLVHTRLIETGGMKGRRKEISKPELLKTLREAFQTQIVYSEYGMTELLSQAYAENGRYQTPPWMRLSLRDATDPLATEPADSGAINVIDLANIHSCSFIATEDLGRKSGHLVEVLGRMDHADIRGCSLLVAS